MSMKTKEFDILAVLAHGKLADENSTFLLPPIDNWTDEFCEALNFLEYSASILFALAEGDNIPILPDNIQSMEKINHDLGDLPKVSQIYIYPDLETAFVRFAGIMILKEKTQTQSCLNSMKKHLGLMREFRQKLEVMGASKEKANLEELQELSRIMALSIYFNVDHLKSETKREQSKNFDVLNEILQNANDKVSDGIVKVESTVDYFKLSYQEEQGFLLKDFLAVSSLGNSGNKDSEKDTTGHKGTGFKGVYQWFRKVEIKSNGILCTLDDERKFLYEKKREIFCNDDVVSADKLPFGKKESGTYHYPLPHFQEQEMEDPLKTEITFYYKQEHKGKNPISQEFFTESKAYYFLSHIKEFHLLLTESNQILVLNRETEMETRFYPPQEYPVPLEEDKILCENMPLRLQNQEEISPEKRTITILFPRIPYPKYDEHNLFVGLPVDEFTGFSGQFYINAPLLELEDNRRNIIKSEDTREGAWNTRLKFHICFAVLKKIELLTQTMETFRNIAYQYFPFHHDQSQEDGWNVYFKKPEGNETALLEEIKFIQASTRSDQIQKEQYSLSQANYLDLLPDYMYQAMIRHGKPYDQENDNPYDQEKPFIYYPNDHVFFSVFQQYPQLFTVPNDETIQVGYYQWALGKDIWGEPVLCHSLLDKLQLKENCKPPLPLLWKFRKNVEEFFAQDGNTFAFKEEIYKKSFSMQRSRLYFFEDALVKADDALVKADDPFLCWVKQNSSLETLYTFQQEFGQNVQCPETDLNALVDGGFVAVKVRDGSYKLFTREMYWTKQAFLTANTIFSLEENNDILQHYCHELDKKQDWKPEFFKFLEQYNETVMKQQEIPAFSFIFNYLSPLDPWIFQLCENNIPMEKLESLPPKKVDYLWEEGQTIGDILKNKVRIYPKTKGLEYHWTFGFEQGEAFLILFGKRSIGKLMEDFFEIPHFSLVKHFTPMKCHNPLPHFGGWDSFPDYETIGKEKFLKVEDIPEYSPQKRTQAYKNNVKSLLIHHYEYQEGKEYRRFQGYGLEKKCPICQAKLMIEQTQLHLRAVRLAKSENQDLWADILCCDNCLATFPYAEEVYFVPTRQEMEEYTSTCLPDVMKEHLLQSNALTLCFQLSNGETRYQDTKVTVLHRKWLLDVLE